MRPAVFVPDSAAGRIKLREMQRDRNHMACWSTHGAIAGPVSIEDV